MMIRNSGKTIGRETARLLECVARRIITAVCVPFLILISCTVTCLHAQDSAVPVFGQGKVNVRLYTDYFCSPCKAMETELEPVIEDLLKKNTIKLIFIDTPFSQYSSLYARYFLYGINDRRQIDHVFAVRNALIAASKENISDPAKIEGFLAARGIKTRPTDTKPVFDFYLKMLKEDAVHSTPTAMIERDGKKHKVTGGPDIIRALKSLQ